MSLKVRYKNNLHYFTNMFKIEASKKTLFDCVPEPIIAISPLSQKGKKVNFFSG